MNLEDYEYVKIRGGYRVKVSCLNCGKEWWHTWSQVRNGGGKYCSRECHDKHRFYSDPDLKKYETRISSNRNIEVKIKCKKCGKEAWARWNRVNSGLGLYCSLKCANSDQKRYKNKPNRLGKENAGIAFDSKANRYYAYWKDEHKKRHNLPYAKWWWEVNVGEIPDGYLASYKDEDASNINDDNICIISRDEYGERISKRLMGHVHSDETKQKISDSRSGKTLSENHKNKISESLVRRWKSGEFNTKKYKEDASNRVKGENNPSWRGGATEITYPPEWKEELKSQVRDRDGYKCRICGKDGKVVHHIDANKHNNDISNLITVCMSCHKKIHSVGKCSNVIILAFRSLLYWDNPNFH